MDEELRDDLVQMVGRVRSFVKSRSENSQRLQKIRDFLSTFPEEPEAENFRELSNLSRSINAAIEGSDVEPWAPILDMLLQEYNELVNQIDE